MNFIHKYPEAQALIQQLGAKNAVNWASKQRAQAAEKLSLMDVPTTKWEEWKYTSVKELLSRTYQSFAPSSNAILSDIQIPDFDAERIVFVNGKCVSACDANLGEKVIFQCFHSVNKDFLEGSFAFENVGNDIFGVLNTNSVEDGIFVAVPEKVVLEKNLHIVHIFTSDFDAAVQYRNIILVGKNASLKMIESYHTLGDSAHTFRNAVSEVRVEDGGKLEYIKIQEEGAKASHIESTTVRQAANTNTKVVTITLGGDLIRNDLRFYLEGKNSEAHLHGAYLLKGAQHLDNHTEVHHKEPHCYSNELYKGIIADKATGVFNGKIHVYKDAQKTNAYQSNRNILLSDEANIYTKPQLEIYADDVKCSHGATTGQMDEEALFYLRARGIKEEDARKLLIHAYIGEVIDLIGNEKVREYLLEKINTSV